MMRTKSNLAHGIFPQLRIALLDSLPWKLFNKVKEDINISNVKEKCVLSLRGEGSRATCIWARELNSTIEMCLT